jgi:ABC-type antimicrobial peptide transport system permease subunit
VLLTSVRLALRGLRRNKLRTLLTMLGIIIGVAAVLTMVALGNGAQQNVSQDVRSAGTNLIHVNAGNYTRGGEESNIASGLGSATTLTPDDAAAIGRSVTGIKDVAPGVKLRGWIASRGRKFYGPILGTGASFASMYGWRVETGRFFTDADIAARRPVAVLGRTVRDQIVGAGAGVDGVEVVIHGMRFAVIGVTDTTDPDQTEMAFVPYTALQDALGISYLHTIAVEAALAGDASRIAADVTALLRDRHAEPINAQMQRLRQGGLTGNQMPQSGTLRWSSGQAGGAPDDFTVKTQASEALTKGLYTSVAAFILANMPKLDEVNLAEMQATLQRANTTMTALLAGIAAISLVVGGVGIMNIMLIAVAERTREIGVRRAVGARRRDVLLQFLVEAVTLSACGGAVGVLLGLAASFGLTALFEWSTRVSAGAIVLAFGMAAAVGVLFGFYPARRASRLDPIDALRAE